MAIDRLQMAQDRLNAYYEAELAVLSGQEYSIGSRKLVRADLAEIRKAINELEQQVKMLTDKKNNAVSSRTRRIVLRDI